MQSLSENQLLLALVAVATILLVGRGAAEVARRLRQPEVLGELLGGFLLGPSVFGALVPAAYRTLFLDRAVGDGLSLLSWIGAILLLLVAGLEVDLHILRAEARPGALAAAGAIVPSIVVGAFFARMALHASFTGGLFLGLVLSVTAVSVVAKILIERDALRRGYAQVALAAGVASEVLVWLLIAVVSALHGGSPILAGLRSAGLALLFFLAMMTLGKRFTFWAMRRMADLTHIVRGELSLVVLLAFLAAALTQGLGLHALLGAFVFGVLLSQAPRATLPLKERVQTLTVSLFAPIFFVLAGMRVDIFALGSASAIGALLLLFVVASLVKGGLGALGARLGGLPTWEAALVGVGLNLKGGTDVIVAILGVELGLLPARLYTMYAIVAILTVLVSPPLLAVLEKKAPPGRAELARLNREEARRRAYLPTLERVLAPVLPELCPAAAAWVVERIAVAKGMEGEIFDITEFAVEPPRGRESPSVAALAEADQSLHEAGRLPQVELSQRHASGHTDALRAILAAAAGHGLIAIGAPTPAAGDADTLSLGELQERLIDEATTDVLVVVGDDKVLAATPIARILVAVNGFEYSLAAGDVAAYVAKATGAELVLLTVAHAKMDPLFWDENEHRGLLEAGYRVLRELTFRIGRLGVRTNEKVELGEDPGAEIVRELRRQPYQLVVLGALDRGSEDHMDLGGHIRTVLVEGATPAVLLVTHE